MRYVYEKIEIIIHNIKEKQTCPLRASDMIISDNKLLLSYTTAIFYSGLYFIQFEVMVMIHTLLDHYIYMCVCSQVEIFRY